MIKQKFGKDIMSRNFASQTNEVLLKIYCHNVCCLIQEYREKNRALLFYKPPQKGGNNKIRLN